MRSASAGPQTVGMARTGDAPAGEPERLTARAGDIAALRFLLGAAQRVSVTGASVSGRSALAASAGAAASADFPEGTTIVPLGAVRDGALVPCAVAQALGVPDDRRLSQLDALRAGLDGKRLLIILDDCDLVADACANLAAELSGHPGVHLAATAMAPVGMPAERVYAVSASDTERHHAPGHPDSRGKSARTLAVRDNASRRRKQPM